MKYTQEIIKVYILHIELIGQGSSSGVQFNQEGIFLHCLAASPSFYSEKRERINVFINCNIIREIT